MRVLVVDDHPLVRKGISSSLSFEDKIEEVKEASNIEEAINILLNDCPEITIIDLNLGREDGLEIIKRSREKNINTKFIVLTSSSKREDFLRAQSFDIDGYILKEAFAEDIIYGINTVVKGKKFFDPEVVKYHMNYNEIKVLDDLTPREKDVLDELGKGISNIEIGQNLFISENTVKKHVSNILSKLKLSHRTEAALYVNNRLNIS